MILKPRLDYTQFYLMNRIIISDFIQSLLLFYYPQFLSLIIIYCY